MRFFFAEDHADERHGDFSTIIRRSRPGHNCTVSKHRNRDHWKADQPYPSWCGLRLANMPLRLWLVLVALLLGGFLVILLHK
jgi:hypothetical protein